MAHTYITYTYNGDTDYDLSFSGGYRVRNEVSAVKVGSPEVPISFDWLSDTRVRISNSGLVNGDLIQFRRTVSKINPPVNMLLPNNFTREAVVTVVNHTMHALQEVLDGRVDSFNGELITDIDSMLAQGQAILDETASARDDAQLSMAQAAASALAADASALLSSGHSTDAGESANRAKTSELLAADLVGSAIINEEGVKFASRAQAEAANIPPALGSFSVVVNGKVLWYVRTATPSALQTADGSHWAPADALVSTEHFGAVSDDASDDTVKLQSAFNSALRVTGGRGSYNVAAGVSPRAGTELSDISIVKTLNSGSGIDGAARNDLTFKGVKVDMGYSKGLTSTVHGIRLQGNNITVADTKVTDFAYNGTSGGGTGVLFAPPTGGRSKGHRLRDSTFIASPTGVEAFGWIMSDVDTSFASNIYTSGAIGSALGTGFGHELKNDSRHNMLTGLIAENCNVALAYGQTTAGIDGCDFNVAVGVVGKGVDRLWSMSEAQENLFVGGLYDPTGAPGILPKNAVEFRNQAGRNAAYAILSRQGSEASVKHDGVNNFVQVAAMENSGPIVQIGVGFGGNVTEVSHPGGRTSILGSIEDNSGNARVGQYSNPVYCNATGEHVGSLSGTFYWSLGLGTTTWNAAHLYRIEAKTNAVVALGTDGTAGNLSGLAVSVPGDANRAGFWMQLGDTTATDRWSFRGFGQGEVVAVDRDAMFPIRDVGDGRSKNLGKPLQRWVNGFIARFRPGDGNAVWTSGAGTPEGVLAAPVGSLYTRTDGGPGTTLYVKESGTGNTGWVAK